MKRIVTVLVFLALASLRSWAGDAEAESGFISLFNGKDLTGWGYKTNQFDGKTQSDDGRFSATNGMLVVNPRKLYQFRDREPTTKST